MSTNAAEWIMAGASVLTGLFVGLQSWTLNQTLNSPFEANLQSRQISVCAEAVRTKEAYLSTQSYGAFEPVKDLSLVWEGKIAEIPEADERGDAKSRFFAEALSASLERAAETEDSFRKALGELKIYASSETAKEIEALSISMGPFAFYKGFLDVQDSSEPIGKRIETLFQPIAKKCRLTMIGESKGLI